MTTIVGEELNNSPFEGPEKLLEIWFAPSAQDVKQGSDDTRSGLRKIDQSIWEEMLAIVRCKVLSVVRGKEMDAYLLSESSLFVAPHKLILKTCGTTLNLLGLPRILSIAESHCNLTAVHRCFYSRKSFMFPDLQSGPHKEWTAEVEFLDRMFPHGSAYTVGKVNGDHWLLYIYTADGDHEEPPVTATHPEPSPIPDVTIEILMSKLGAHARRQFFYPESAASPDVPSTTPHHLQGGRISSEIGVSSLFPEHSTVLDAFSFEPCGYSANALVSYCVKAEEDPGSETKKGREGYYTIHVTPEEGWSFASFESNVPLLPINPLMAPESAPDLTELIRKVVKIFQPDCLTMTLFVEATPGNSGTTYSSISEFAQAVFRDALDGHGYRRTDKINYEFSGYDLAFASFEKKHAHAEPSKGRWNISVCERDGDDNENGQKELSRIIEQTL